MQTLARQGYTVEQITALLKAERLTVSAGCEVRDLNLTFLQDISDTLIGGTVNYHSEATGQHRDCSVQLATELVWGQVLVCPYMVLGDDAGTLARFDAGAFHLVTPKRILGVPEPVYSLQGYDRLYLLARSVGDSYGLLAGSNVIEAIHATIAAAGLTGVMIDGTAQDKTLPTDKSWLLVRPERDEQGQFLPGHGSDYTWLDIVNELLALIGYRPLWADENGLYRSEPNVDPSVRPVEFVFDADEELSIVGEDRSMVEDMWQTPNRWVFIQQNRDTEAPTATEGDGIYTIDNISDGPTSQEARGLIWPKPVQQLDAADQASLVAQGNAIAAKDKRISQTIEAVTGPFPAAGHGDVYLYVDNALGEATTRKVTSLSWTLDLLGADMKHEWAVIQ